MGNRAVITVGNAAGHYNSACLGVYLHWNCGRDSVTAFLTYCKLHGFRAPSEDAEYGFAGLVQVISNFFGGGLSVGIGIVSSLDCDNYDNGVYTIEGWDIVGRKYFDGVEQNEYDLNEMLLDIDDSQPTAMQIRQFLEAEPVDVKDLKIGDKVVFIDYNGKCVIDTVVGYGSGTVNGSNVTGIPYLDRWSSGHPETNPNNYLLQPCYGAPREYRRAK